MKVVVGSLRPLRQRAEQDRHDEPAQPADDAHEPADRADAVREVVRDVLVDGGLADPHREPEHEDEGGEERRADAERAACIVLPAAAYFAGTMKASCTSGNMSRKEVTTQVPSTPYITVRAPKRSESQPPGARMIPEGKTKSAVRSAAVRRSNPYTSM